MPVHEDHAAERPESPAAKRQRKLVQKMSEEARSAVLRQCGRRYLRLLSLGCFGRRLGFRLC
jgi:hypothetical protein